MPEEVAECPHCHSKSFEHRTQDSTPLDRSIDILTADGALETIPQMTEPVYQDMPMYGDNGQLLIGDYGETMMNNVLIEPERPNEVPAYKLKQYPIILRRNISKTVRY